MQGHTEKLKASTLPTAMFKQRASVSRLMWRAGQRPQHSSCLCTLAWKADTTVLTC